MSLHSTGVVFAGLFSVLPLGIAAQAALPPAGQTTQSQATQTAPSTPPATTPPAQAPQSFKSEIIQRVLVKVNGEAFTQTDLERLQTETLAQQNQQANVKDAQTDSVLQRRLQQITPGILVKAVDDMLLVQKARELGYKMSDDQYKKLVDNIKADNHLNDEQFKAALVQEGLTQEQLRKNLEQGYLEQAVQQTEVMGHSQMTEQEARQYYNSHQSEFMTPARVVLREILVSVSTSQSGGQTTFSAGSDEAAREKANQIHDRLTKGEDFAKVAAEVSDSATKSSGGVIGAVNVADMSDTLRPIIDALKPGDFTTPIRTPRGYQILKLDSRSETQPKPFDDVRDQIAQKIYEARVGGETQKYLQKLRAQALIEWKDQNLKDMYDKQMSEKAAGGRP